MKDIIHYIADELVEKVLENFKNTNMHLNDLCAVSYTHLDVYKRQA